MYGGGGHILKSVGRAVTRANVTAGVLQEPFSSSSSVSSVGLSSNVSAPTSTHTLKPISSNNPSIPSSSSNNIPNPKSPNSSAKTINPYWYNSDEFDWVSVDGCDDERSFGSAPSMDEVQSAVSALQLFNPDYPQFVRDKYVSELDKADAELVTSPNGSLYTDSSVESESDWLEPSFYICNSRYIGIDRVYDAFHMLRNDQGLQKMVISLSSDKTVWDAVLNNEVVKEIRESYLAENSVTQGLDDTLADTPKDSNEETNFLKWIFDNTKAKFVDIIGKITEVVNKIVHGCKEETTTDETLDPMKKMRTSFMLAVIVMLIVVAARAHVVR